MGQGWNKDLSELLFSSVPKGARRACWCLLSWGVLLAIMAAFIISMSFEPKRTDLRSGRGIAFICVIAAMAIIAIAAAFAIERRKKWGRALGWVTAVLSLPFFPGGTILAVYIIMGLTSGEMSRHYEVPSSPESTE